MAACCSTPAALTIVPGPFPAMAWEHMTGNDWYMYVCIYIYIFALEKSCDPKILHSAPLPHPKFFFFCYLNPCMLPRSTMEMGATGSSGAHPQPTHDLNPTRLASQYSSTAGPGDSRTTRAHYCQLTIWHRQFRAPALLARPCVQISKGGVCPSGTACTYCHFPHRAVLKPDWMLRQRLLAASDQDLLATFLPFIFKKAAIEGLIPHVDPLARAAEGRNARYPIQGRSPGQVSANEDVFHVPRPGFRG